MNDKTERMINWGILGCAGIAEARFLPGLQGAQNARLLAIAGRGNTEKLDRFRRKFQPPRTYDSYESLLRDPEVDAVYIPQPNGLHAEWAIRAMNMKKHVLCEKPLGTTAAEVQAMFAASRKNGVLLMEAFAYRHSPLTEQVRQLAAGGAIGRIRFIEAHFTYNIASEENVRLSAKLSGGATYDVGCYNISLIRHLAGSEPVSVLASGKLGAASGVDEETCAVLTFANGVTGLSYCSFRSFERNEYLVAGERGIIHVPVGFNFAGKTAVMIRTGDGVREIEVDCPDNYRLEADQFSRAILGLEQPLIGYDESIGNAKVIDRILQQVRVEH